MSPRTMVLRWVIGLLLTAQLVVAVPQVSNGIISLLMLSSWLMWSIGSSLPRQPCLYRTQRSPEIDRKGFLFILSPISKDHHDSDDQDCNDYNKGNYLTNFNKVCHRDGYNVSQVLWISRHLIIYWIRFTGLFQPPWLLQTSYLVQWLPGEILLSDQMISFWLGIYSTVTETVTINGKEKREASPLWSRASPDRVPLGLLEFSAAIIKDACSCVVAPTTTTTTTTSTAIVTIIETVKLNEYISTTTLTSSRLRRLPRQLRSPQLLIRIFQQSQYPQR